VIDTDSDAVVFNATEPKSKLDGDAPPAAAVPGATRSSRTAANNAPHRRTITVLTWTNTAIVTPLTRRQPPRAIIDPSTRVVNLDDHQLRRIATILSRSP
jgi:hypothetical protein